MKRTFLSIVTCAVGLMTLSENAYSWDSNDRVNACNVEFRNDITVSPEHIEITSASGENMLINSDHDVFVNGETVSLDDDERALVEKYAAEVRTTIPRIVALALEGVEVAMMAITEVFSALTETEPPASLVASINDIQEEISYRMYRDGNTVHMKGGEIKGVEAAMANIEPALEKAIADSMGDLIMSVGASIKDGEGTFTERLARFASKMEGLEEDIERKVASKAHALEKQAEGLCDQVYALQAVETALHTKVPATRSFDLVRES